MLLVIVQVSLFVTVKQGYNTMTRPFTLTGQAINSKPERGGSDLLKGVMREIHHSVGFTRE